MTEVSDTDDGETRCDVPELSSDLEEQLENYPELAEYIATIKNHVKRQNKRINRLQNKLAKFKRHKCNCAKKQSVEKETQTESEENKVLDWNVNDEGKITDLVDQVTLAAESAVQQTGFVYEKTSGLYYDYNSGYYYDPKLGLYYDGNKGMYLIYDEETKSYKFHSQVVPESEPIKEKKVKKKKKRKGDDEEDKDEAKRHKVRTSDESDGLEEGECVDSSNDSAEDNVKTDSSTDSENEKDIAKTYPPCMRIVVKETSLPNLKIGTLFLVTYTGGSVGREGDHAVLIPDINISKHHAKLQFNEQEKQYEIIDLGSRNGTYLNSKRLSVAKQESEPTEVAHGSIIQLGVTKLLCHVHSGHATCGHCEPGLLQLEENPSTNSAPRRNHHKSELRRLKTMFGVENDNVESASQVAAGYQDRAHARRKIVGSSDQHAKTQQSSLDVSINKDNKGFKLLSKMGWTEGNSLGKSGDGLLEPVPLVKNASKAGLGSDGVDLSELEVDPNVGKKRALWQKTQQRYYEIPE